jgi:phage shock protein PspC (stress-responsive transcriptional regulator)
MTEHKTQTTHAVKRLERSGDRILAGVAGGLGRYFELNPTFFRIGFAVLTLLGGAGVLAYLAAVLVIPDEGKEDSIAAEVLRQRRERPWPVVGLGLAAVALLVLLSRATFWPAAGAGWVLVLLAGLAILWTFDARRGGRRARVLVRALVALTALAVAAAVAAVVLAFSVFDVSLGDGVGDRTVVPASVRSLEPSYKLGVGDLRVDLSNVRPIATTRRVSARVGIGELRIVVPPGTAVTAHAKLGVIRAFGHRSSGHDSRFNSPSKGALVVDASVGAGRIDIVRAVR